MLTFDVERHVYTWEGRTLPSVTGALRVAGHLDDLAWFGSPAALVRGRAVHGLTALMDATGWDDPRKVCRLPRGWTHAPREILIHKGAWGLCAACSPEHEPFFLAYRKFKALAAGRWAKVETPLARPDLGYAGTPDRLGVLNGRPTVLEIKTGGDAPWHGYQLAAYDMLDPLPFTRDRAAVYLLGDGSFRFKRYADAEDRMHFLRALTRTQQTGEV